MTNPTPTPSPGAEIGTTVPTVARLGYAKRCIATTQVDLRKRRRCRLYSDVALDGQVLCLLHLGEALWARRPPRPVVGEDPPRGPVVMLADYQRRGDLLRETLGHLHAGVADPTTNGQQVLAVVPRLLVERIEDNLARPLPPRAGRGGT